MHIALWILQVLLAGVFLMAGVFKTFTPIDEIAAQMAWAGEYPAWMTRMAGASELLGAIGLIAPAAARIKPQLTALAAAGLAFVMLLAAVVVHIPMGDFAGVVPNIVLGGLAAAVAYGRWKLVPIEERGATVTGAAAAS